MAVTRLSDFATPSTTANNAERFGAWTPAGGGDRITLLAECLSGTATDADVRAYVNGKRLHLVASATQQTTRRVIAFELLAHEMPKGSVWQVAVYWPSATRIHITAAEWSGTRQRATPSSDVFFATSASAQNANLTATAPSNGAALHMMCWFGGTSSWTLGSGQTKIGSDNQQTTFLSVGGYETGLASGSQASNCSVGAAAAAIGQICMLIAEDAQGVVSLDPADGATSVSTSPTLTLEMSAAPSAGSGNLRVYETAAPSASPTVDDAATSSNATNASPFTVTIPTTAAGQRLLVLVASDGARYSAGVITDTGSPSPWHGVYRGAGWLICYRECDGSEPSTYDFATAPADGCVARAYLISGHDPTTPPELAFAIGDSGTVDPPSLTFSWGTEPTLVFALAGMDNGSTATGYPSGYTGTGTQASTQGTAGDRAGAAWSYLSGVTSGSANPGTFSLSAGEGWNGITIGIRPADPSTLVDTVAIGSATIASNDVEFGVSGLAPSTAHHALLDAGAIVDFEGFWTNTAWNFETGAGGGDPVDTVFEVDEANTLAGAKRGTFAAATSDDSATALTGTKSGVYSAASSVSTATAPSARKSGGYAGAAEAGAAMALAGSKSGDYSPGTEADAAHGPSVGVETAPEVDVALPLAGRKRGAYSAAASVATAQTPAGTKRGLVAPASSAESALPLAGIKLGTFSAPPEVDTASTPEQPGAIVPAREADSAQALTGSKRGAYAPAQSASLAVGLLGRKLGAATLASELDGATALDGRKAGTYADAGEADTAGTPVVPPVPTGPPRSTIEMLPAPSSTIVMTAAPTSTIEITNEVQEQIAA